MSDFATVPVRGGHRLAIVYRFRDTFDQPPGNPPAIRAPLQVSLALPDRTLTALFVEHDATYRFRVPLDGLPLPPPTTYPVTVTSLDRRYTNFEPFDAELPVTWAGLHPTSGDYLRVRELWPTPAFRVPDGETAVYGRIDPGLTGDPVNDLKVRIYKGIVPASPYTRTNDAGEFLFRLPKLPGVGTTDTVNILVEDSIGSVSVTPATFTVLLGKAQITSFTRT